MGFRDWFDEQSKPVRLAADGVLAATTIGIWMSVWFSDGDAAITLGATLIAIILGIVTVVTAPELQRSARVWLMAAVIAVSLGDSGFVYWHRHSLAGSTQATTHAPVLVKPSPLPAPPASLIKSPKPLKLMMPHRQNAEPASGRVLSVPFAQFERQFLGKTSVQADALMKLYWGDWISITGYVMNVDGPEPNDAYFVSVEFRGKKNLPEGSQLLSFNSNMGDLQIDQKITALCQIYAPDKYGLRMPFSNCRIQTELH